MTTTSKNVAATSSEAVVYSSPENGHQYPLPAPTAPALPPSPLNIAIAVQVPKIPSEVACIINGAMPAHSPGYEPAVPREAFLANGETVALPASATVASDVLPSEPTKLLDTEIPVTKPDFNLPRDSYGLPYGPSGIHYSTMGNDANQWEDAYTFWMNREAIPAERSFALRRDDFVTKASSLINKARQLKHPAMPMLAGIDYYDIPHNFDDLTALWEKLNDAERDYVGWLHSVPEFDPNYPTKTDCYCPAGAKFYRKSPHGWRKFNFTQYQEQLAAEGYDIGGRTKITRDSEVSKITQRVTLHQVKVVEKLSGLDEGYHTMGNGAGEYLALRGPVFPEEEDGPAPSILRFLMELTGFGLDNGEQFGKVMDWLADAYQCRKEVNRRQHRALLMAGPKNSGKGVFTKTLLATLLGGRDRTTNAAKYLLGKTEFNGEWMKADLLYVDDAVGDGKMTTKIQTADAIKSVVAGDGIQSIHGKGIEAVDMPVWWRLLICLNDTEEVLATLPPLIDGFDDKFIMIQCHPTLLGGDGDMTPFIDAIKSEIGKFARMLANRAISAKDGRGPKSWIAPVLRDKLLASSPETELLDLLIRARDHGLFDERGTKVNLSESSRDKLHLLLAKNAATTYSNLCRTAKTLGGYMRRMERHGWVTSRLKDGYTVWSWADAGHSGK